jgi:hypothetical protein
LIGGIIVGAHGGCASQAARDEGKKQAQVGDERDLMALTAEESRAIRQTVYKNTPKVGGTEDFIGALMIPDEPKSLYKRKPHQVVNLLLVVLDGASPRDSVLAAAYAMELLGGRGRGVVCIDHFDEDTYDTVLPKWACTPREHWKRRIQTKLKQTPD